MVAKVLIDNSNKKLNKVYDYLLKKEDEYTAEIGKRVKVNFGNGKGRSVEGIIVRLIKDDEYDKSSKLKYIDSILDKESFLDESKLKLAKWISKMYFCNVYSALKLMLPDAGEKLNKKAVVGKQINVLVLNKSSEEIERDIEAKKITSARHIKLLRELITNPKIPMEDIINSLNISKDIIKKVEKNGYIKIIKEDVLNTDYSNVQKSYKLINLIIIPCDVMTAAHVDP